MALFVITITRQRTYYVEASDATAAETLVNTGNSSVSEIQQSMQITGLDPYTTGKISNECATAKNLHD